MFSSLILMMFSLFKKNKASQFKYIPRYYSEKKLVENSLMSNTKKHIMKGHFVQVWKRNVNTNANKKSTIRVLLIIITLMFIAYKIILFKWPI